MTSLWWCMLDFSKHLVCINPIPFLKLTVSSHSYLPVSDQQLIDRTKLMFFFCFFLNPSWMYVHFGLTLRHCINWQIYSHILLWLEFCLVKISRIGEKYSPFLLKWSWIDSPQKYIFLNYLNLLYILIKFIINKSAKKQIKEWLQILPFTYHSKPVYLSFKK